MRDHVQSAPQNSPSKRERQRPGRRRPSRKPVGAWAAIRKHEPAARSFAGITTAAPAQLRLVGSTSTMAGG